MNAAPAIRQATADDLSGVLALYAQPDIDDGVVLLIEAARDILARFALYPDYRLFVAVDDAGQILGSYVLLIMDNIGHMGAPSAIVEDVVVDPQTHGQGIGTAMMRHAMTEAAARCCYKIVLSSNEKRQRAHAFYEGLGFKRHGWSFHVGIDTGGDRA